MPNFSVFLRKAGVPLRWLQAQEKSPESACRDVLGAGHARTRYTGYFVQVIASCFYARYFMTAQVQTTQVFSIPDDYQDVAVRAWSESGLFSSRLIWITGGCGKLCIRSRALSTV
jgi:hypothetical protein